MSKLIRIDEKGTREINLSEATEISVADYNAPDFSIGDEVAWRGAWGTEAPKKAIIKSIEICEEKRSKFGESVNSCTEAEREYCVFDLSNGHWAYGEQIAKA